MDCRDRNLAYAEMRLVMARMLWTFDLKLDESAHPDDSITSTGTSGGEAGEKSEQGPGEWQEKQRVFLIWEKRPLMVKLRVRDGLGDDARERDSGIGGGGQGGGLDAPGSIGHSGSGSGVMPMGSNVAESAAWSA